MFWAALVICLPLAVPISAFADAIGAVTQVRSTAYGTPPASPRVAKHVEDPLVFKETLETLSFSALEANLSDGSVVTLGASAKVVLDEFVYDPGAAASGLLINMGEGSLRFVTGEMKKESFRLQTPTATLAIRGTNFRVRVRPNGDTLVAVDEGIVLVTVTSTGQVVEVREGQSVEIRRVGEAEFNRKDDKNLAEQLLPFLFPGSDDDGDGSSAPPPRAIIIGGKTYYDQVTFNPDEPISVGNPIVDYGWDNVAITGAGNNAVGVVASPTTITKTPGDRPDQPGSPPGQYGGDGCECSF